MVESWTEYWYPVHELKGGFVEAEPDLALNARFLPGAAAEKPLVEILLSPTVGIPRARVSVTLGGETLRELDAALKPLTTAKFEVPVEDLERAKLVVLVGSNAAWCHPVLYQRMAQAKQDHPDLRVALIDPRRTASADLADLHLAVRPGTDGVLFNGLLVYLKDLNFD
ncbi:MAG: molybdopterin-dependent oxidoreductase, partial [Acidobacteriia bacterium]|nr:molybdopterin-dependent oxidoreductase [Terriglobia bacterium]